VVSAPYMICLLTDFDPRDDSLDEWKSFWCYPSCLECQIKVLQRLMSCKSLKEEPRNIYIYISLSYLLCPDSRRRIVCWNLSFSCFIMLPWMNPPLWSISSPFVLLSCYLPLFSLAHELTLSYYIQTVDETLP